MTFDQLKSDSAFHEWIISKSVGEEPHAYDTSTGHQGAILLASDPAAKRKYGRTQKEAGVKIPPVFIRLDMPPINGKSNFLAHFCTT